MSWYKERKIARFNDFFKCDIFWQNIYFHHVVNRKIKFCCQNRLHFLFFRLILNYSKCLLILKIKGKIVSSRKEDWEKEVFFLVDQFKFKTIWAMERLSLQIHHQIYVEYVNCTIPISLVRFTNPYKAPSGIFTSEPAQASISSSPDLIAKWPCNMCNSCEKKMKKRDKTFFFILLELRQNNWKSFDKHFFGNQFWVCFYCFVVCTQNIVYRKNDYSPFRLRLLIGLLSHLVWIA